MLFTKLAAVAVLISLAAAAPMPKEAATNAVDPGNLEYRHAHHVSATNAEEIAKRAPAEAATNAKVAPAATNAEEIAKRAKTEAATNANDIGEEAVYVRADAAINAVEPGKEVYARGDAAINAVEPGKEKEIYALSEAAVAV